MIIANSTSTTKDQAVKSRESENPSFLELPYSDRQMIVVTDDAVAESARQAEREAGRRKQPLNWQQVAEVALKSLVAISLPLISVSVESAPDLIRSWSRLRSDGVRVLQVGKSETTSVGFPPGHPRERVIYIGHPAMPSIYYTAADFHRVTFEHKFSEAITLLMHLGATTIRVERVHGWSKELAASLSVPIRNTGVTGSVDTGSKKTAQDELLFEAELSGTPNPQIPHGLVWYQHEPTWQTIANGRKDFGLRKFSLNVSYEDDFGVNAGLKMSADRAGFDLGGRFAAHEETTWKISGVFGAVEVNE